MVETSAYVLLYVQWVRKKLVNVKKKDKKIVELNSITEATAILGECVVQVSLNMF